MSGCSSWSVRCGTQQNTTFVQGDPWSGSAPGEWYAYDADGYRFLRLSRDSAGKAVLSLRDGEGRTLSEFVDELERRAEAGTGLRLRGGPAPR